MAPPWFTALANPPFHLATILLHWQLEHPQYAIESGGTAEYKGTTLSCVITSLNAGIVQRAVTSQKWCFDPYTSLPVFVVHRDSDTRNPTKFTLVMIEFGDFRTKGGVLTPYRLDYSEEGVRVSTIVIEALKFNVGISTSDFDPLGGGQ